ncbi:MAG: murein L,D-transpeptidase [Actinobacteria bacterium]|nr:murein L,D-transpeptidase [Actinomycetota bacterium]
MKRSVTYAHALLRVAAVVGITLTVAISSVPAARAVTESPSRTEIVRIQQTLQHLGLYRGQIDGSHNKATADAIMAFHKVVSADRTSEWTHEDWQNVRALAAVGYDIPERPDEPDRIEVDLYRQVMYLVEGGDVAGIFPIVSGRGDTYERLGRRTGGAHTPVGDYTLIRHVAGWRYGSYGPIYRPWYFIGGYAIHGSKVARPQPASNGCVRIPMQDIDWLEGRLELGMPVHVWVGRPSSAVAAFHLEHLAASLQYDIV